ncbi:DUF4252 domain-containing protein [Tamlana haliotis]|uniref:DUF4252 domain-containing protein n=1 Tax=Pseudotamlana haliotis TaxID=2614804 RepID=A0A6N6MKF0_9FLAO|nr:DUF4252 domain-containing protein [Tamlana haliotis]KAB1069371.1 DUF4252 domain-containing protein [Tamlana haliotis]
MKNTVKTCFLALVIAFGLTSCNDSETLQRYFVEHQETKDFISQDFPLSMVDVDKSQFTKQQLEAYNSVDKLNFIGFKITPDNVDTYNAEVEKIKGILKDDKYNDLMELNIKGDRISVQYTGTDAEADEVIIFGSSKDKGFGIVRVLGDDMHPEKLATLIKAFKDSDFDKAKVESIVNFFE